MENFAGSWTLCNSEHFDEYMKALGVNMITRGLANKATPTVTFSPHPDGSWTFKTASTLKTVEVTFKLDEQFEETTLDGRNTKSVFTLDGGKLKQVQKATKHGERDTEVHREVSGDQLIATMPLDNIVCVRTYKRD